MVRLGQNFLADPNLLDAIVRDAELEADDVALEIGGGEGALHRVRMSVNDSGKLDLYQWLDYLGQHARRHLAQMAANISEWQRCSARPGP